MHTHITAAGLLLLCALPRIGFAQAAPAASTAPTREGSAEFAFVGTTGNSATQTIGLGGELIYRPAPWETRLKLSYVRNEADDELKAQSFVLSVRVQPIQPPVPPRLTGYVQYGYQRDRFAGILDRNTIEGGLSYGWIVQEAQKLVVDAGFGYANELRVFGANLSNATFDTGALYSLKISAGSELSEEGHLVQSLSDGSDWRYTNAVALSAKVSAIFSLKVSNTIRYLNLPVEGLKRTDAVTAVALVAKF
jgi:putative salt-induced outer membrane protein YdiY